MINQKLWDGGFTRIPNALSDLLTERDGLAVCVFAVLLLEVRAGAKAERRGVVTPRTRQGLDVGAGANGEGGGLKRVENGALMAKAGGEGLKRGGSEGLLLKRGEAVVTIGAIAALIGVTYHRVRAAMMRLEELGLIRKQTTRRIKNGRTLVTICDYDRYNGVYVDGAKARQEQDAQFVTKNTKNFKKEKIKRKRMGDDGAGDESAGCGHGDCERGGYEHGGCEHGDCELDGCESGGYENTDCEHDDYESEAAAGAADGAGCGDDMSDAEREYMEGMRLRYPRIMSMKRPLMYDEFLKLVERYGRELVVSKIAHLENYAKIGRYASAYLTINNWAGGERRVKN